VLMNLRVRKKGLYVLVLLMILLTAAAAGAGQEGAPPRGGAEAGRTVPPDLPAAPPPPVVRGIYGVPAVGRVDPAGYERELRAAGVNAVFVPADDATVEWFGERGYRVFLSVNAFGGRGPWAARPDSRPVTAAGHPYGADRPGEAEIGGVCPTHPEWRAARLNEIRRLLQRFGARTDGLWLDFIRYPGLWERTGAAAYYPDTCYCPRCRRLFARHLTAAGKAPGVSLAEMEPAAAAAWIRRHHPREWIHWKQEQILSFVRDVGKLRDELIGKREGEAPSAKAAGATAAGPATAGSPRAPAGPGSAAAKAAVPGEGAAARAGVVPAGTSVRPYLIGVFTVPWTKGERDGAVSRILAQDPFALGKLVDVVSPMVYHRMTGRTPGWVGELTAYLQETIPAAVWPIIQAEDTGAAEFRAAVDAAAAAGADGLLVYSFGGMKKGLWGGLAAFRSRENLLPNPELAVPAGATAPPGWTGCPGARSDEMGSRCFTRPAAALARNPLVLRRSPFAGAAPAASREASPAPSPGKVREGAGEPAPTVAEGPAAAGSRERERERERETAGFPLTAAPARDVPGAVGIRAGRDGRGEWRAAVPPCEPGREYLFQGYFYRDYWENGSYAKIGLWGRQIDLNNHLQSKQWQPLRGYFTCPGPEGHRPEPGPEEGDDATAADSNVFTFTSGQAGKTFWMTRPLLTPVPAGSEGPRREESEVDTGAGSPSGLYENFFPIGVYGAGRDDLEQIRRLGLNTVVIGGSGPALHRTLAACHEQNLRYVLSVPHDPEHLRPYLDDIAAHVRPGYPAFYVNDEPEIRSAPVNAAVDVQRFLKDRYPGAATCMAVVRPAACRDYIKASDFFMMDQYPVIGMPMTLLSDSLDRAARDVGRDRLLAVVQAFREPRSGWPRLPSREEMDVLAFLAVVHGSRGIFFYTYSDIGRTEEGRQDLAWVAGRLNRLYPWLLVPNTATEIPVRMLSRYRWDPRGRPAVHVAVKRRGRETLLIAVNSIGAPVEAELTLPGAPGGSPAGRNETVPPCAAFTELFGNEKYPVRDGRLRSFLDAYETKAFHCAR